MSEIVNLRRERKRRKLREDAKKAEKNRMLFGRTKAKKQSDSHEKLRKIKFFDDRRLFDQD